MDETKINFNGLYRHKPEAKYSRHDDLYWCQNWTFRPHKYKDEVYMKDTYWGYGDSLTITVTDDNIDEFEFLFDFDEVQKVYPDNIHEFGEKDKDWFAVPIDSGGFMHPTYFIKKGRKRDVAQVIARKEDEIKDLKRKIELLMLEINNLKRNLE